MSASLRQYRGTSPPRRAGPSGLRARSSDALDLTGFVSQTQPDTVWGRGYGGAIGARFFGIVTFEGEAAWHGGVRDDLSMTTFTAAALVSPPIGPHHALRWPLRGDVPTDDSLRLGLRDATRLRRGCEDQHPDEPRDQGGVPRLQPVGDSTGTARSPLLGGRRALLLARIALPGRRLTDGCVLHFPPTMVFLNYATMQMTAKIVYYGPGLCGKTTNLQWIHQKTAPSSRGDMVSLETEADRTLFFDLLPLEVGFISGMRVRLQLYTVPGQVFYNTTRRMVLEGRRRHRLRRRQPAGGARCDGGVVREPQDEHEGARDVLRRHPPRLPVQQTRPAEHRAGGAPPASAEPGRRCPVLRGLGRPRRGSLRDAQGHLTPGPGLPAPEGGGRRQGEPCRRVFSQSLLASHGYAAQERRQTTRLGPRFGIPWRCLRHRSTPRRRRQCRCGVRRRGRLAEDRSAGVDAGRDQHPPTAREPATPGRTGASVRANTGLVGNCSAGSRVDHHRSGCATTISASHTGGRTGPGRGSAAPALGRSAPPPPAAPSRASAPASASRKPPVATPPKALPRRDPPSPAPAPDHPLSGLGPPPAAPRILTRRAAIEVPPGLLEGATEVRIHLGVVKDGKEQLVRDVSRAPVPDQGSSAPIALHLDVEVRPKR